MSVDAELTEDLAPLLPPPPVQETPTAPILRPMYPDRPTVSEQPVRLTLVFYIPCHVVASPGTMTVEVGKAVQTDVGPGYIIAVQRPPCLDFF